MRDFLPADVRRRDYVIGVIKEVYESYGFEPLETPAVENIETLMGKYGEEGNQLIYKILKRGEHEKTGEPDLALRYDLTVPLARVVAQYQNDLPKFFKRYQIQPVWRADRPARGRFREFYQCDVDILGSRSMVVEAEICAAANDVLTKLGFNNFVIRINHRYALTGLLQTAGIAVEKHDGAVIALDKLDKIGRAGVTKEFHERGIEEPAGARLLDFFAGLRDLDHAAEIAAAEDAPQKRKVLNAALLGRLVEFVGDNELGARGVDELRSIIEFAEAEGIGARIEIDPSLARGLSYYTGAIMEINIKDLPGSLGGGGRYDNLVGMFSKESIPACGFSLGLERILTVMNERGLFPPGLSEGNVDVMVAMTEESFRKDVELASYLRHRGINVFTYPQPDKIEKQRVYADRQKIRFVVQSHSDEMFVILKDLLTRDSSMEPKERAADLMIAWHHQRQEQMAINRNFPKGASDQETS